MEILSSIWMMFTASAPWLLVGFIIAGFLHEILSEKLVAKYLRGNSWKSVVNSSLIGIPLPLCSCSVIPVAVSLRRRGASKGATASFLVSTPEIGVDSFLLSYALLGPLITFARVIAAFVSAMLAGIGITLIDKNGTGESTEENNESSSPSCCHTAEDIAEKPPLITRALRYSFTNLVDDLAMALMIGLIIAGVISAIVPPDLVASLNLPPMLMMLAMFVISAPFYVCATSSTPLAAALLVKGFPPGAILVFLLAGPATNITTMLAVLKELGAKSLCIYLLSVFTVTLITASIIDQMSSALSLSSLIQELGHHHSESSAWSHLAGLILFCLLASSLLRKHLKKRAAANDANSEKSCCSKTKADACC